MLKLVLRVAVPPLRVPLPMAVPPSRKVTVPVDADGFTLALSVTAWPVLTLLLEVLSVTLVLMGALTTSLTWFDVLAA